MPYEQENIILCVKIDYADDLKREFGLFRENNEEWEYIKHVAERVIEHELPMEMEQIFDINIRTRILAVREGSLILFFEVILAGYNIISNYEGFLNSIKVIETQCNRLLKVSLRDSGSNNYNSNKYDKFEVNVKTEIKPYKVHTFENPKPQISQQRDGFFYYLLAMNTMLLIIMGLLVYKAVMKTYFT